MAVARGLAALRTITPSLGTGANATGTNLFLTTEVPAALSGTCGILESLTVLDKASNSQAIDLYFFSKAPAASIGAVNAAFAPTDADMVFCLGKVAVAAADFSASGANNSTATKVAIGLLLCNEDSRQGAANKTSNSIWIVGVCRSGTPTYAASDLVFKIGILQE